MRQALAAYYAEAGGGDPVRIDLPKGRYVPVFSSRVAPAPAPFVKATHASVVSRLRIGAALTVAVMFLAGGLIAWRWRQPVTAGQPRLIQLTVPDANNNMPSASADGRLIAYYSDLEGTYNVYIQSFASRKAIRLTTHPSGGSDPDISRDGKRVVFPSMRDGGGIYVISTAGGPETRLAPGFSPRFSPDGARVAYSAIEHYGEGAVFVMPSKGGDGKRVSGNLVNAQDPVWSPDGNRLVAASDDSEAPAGPPMPYLCVGKETAVTFDQGAPADVIIAHISSLTPGEYRLRWQVLALDGHITRGDVPFSVVTP